MILASFYVWRMRPSTCEEGGGDTIHILSKIHQKQPKNNPNYFLYDNLTI